MKRLNLDEICQLEVLIVSAIEETDISENIKCYRKLQKKLGVLKKELLK